MKGSFIKKQIKASNNGKKDEDKDVLGSKGIIVGKEKYDGKPIKFIERPDHYELIFSQDFKTEESDLSIHADLINDIKEADKEKEIHVWINSNGGDTSVMMLIISLIRDFDHVVTIGLGAVCSAGFVLWSLGKERYLDENTTCVYHSITYFCGSRPTDVEDASSYLKKFQESSDLFVSDVLTEEEMKIGKMRDVYLMGYELIERGAAIPYGHYKDRESFVPVVACRFSEDIYVNVNGLYHQVEITEDGKTMSEIITDNISKLSNTIDPRELIKKIGVNYINFFQLFIDIHTNHISEGFSVSSDYLLEFWSKYDSRDVDTQLLINKFKCWLAAATCVDFEVKDGIIFLKGDDGEKEEEC